MADLTFHADPTEPGLELGSPEAKPAPAAPHTPADVGVVTPAPAAAVSTPSAEVVVLVHDAAVGGAAAAAVTTAAASSSSLSSSSSSSSPPPPPSARVRLCRPLVTYVKRWRGQSYEAGAGAGWWRWLLPAATERYFPPFPPLHVIAFSWIGGFAGIACVLGLQAHVLEFTRIGPHHLPLSFFMASLGASAVLIYSAIKSPLAQPRNVFFGHLVSAAIGCFFGAVIDTTWLAGALAVAFSITAMEILGCVHPPGGATALIAVTGDANVRNLGFLFVVSPVLTGVALMIAVAVIIDNINRAYPMYWCWIPSLTLATPPPKSAASLPAPSAALAATAPTPAAALPLLPPGATTTAASPTAAAAAPVAPSSSSLSGASTSPVSSDGLLPTPLLPPPPPPSSSSSSQSIAAAAPAAAPAAAAGGAPSSSSSSSTVAAPVAGPTAVSPDPTAVTATTPTGASAAVAAPAAYQEAAAAGSSGHSEDEQQQRGISDAMEAWLARAPPEALRAALRACLQREHRLQEMLLHQMVY